MLEGRHKDSSPSIFFNADHYKQSRAFSTSLAYRALGRAFLTTHGVLDRDTRRILPGSASLFKTDFEAWATTGGAAGFYAALAFPDPTHAELLHHMLRANGDLQAGAAGEAFARAPPEDVDTFEVRGYGKVS